MCELKLLLEILYYLSAIGILIVAIFGLKQLSIAKNNLIITSKREAGTLASEQVKYYHEFIIPMLNKLDKHLIKYKYPKYIGNIKKFSSDDLLEDPNWYKQWLEHVLKINPDIQVLNSLEAFATYFTSKMADEEIAFSAVGLTYCNSIEKLFPFIATNISSNHQYYTNIKDLYQIWSIRLKREKLHNQVKERLTAIDGIEKEKINPIGTK